MITASKDAYTWRVTYQSGFTLDEYDEDRPDGRGFGEVYASQVRTLELSPHRVDVPLGATPVFFRRRRMELNPNNDSVANSGTTHCIGWRSAESACYLFIREDGSTLLTDDVQGV